MQSKENNIVTVCKIHGPLTQKDIKKRKNYESKQCAMCYKQKSNEYYREKGKFNKKDLPDDWAQRSVVMNCKIHGAIGPNDAKYRNDHNISCILCNREYAAQNKAKRRELFKVDLDFKQQELEKSRAIKKAFKEKNPEAAIEFKLNKKYGITLATYKEMLEEQNHACKICKKNEGMAHNTSGSVRRLSVDHCHRTGYVRGLLCNKCNLMIAMSLESIDTLQSGIDYLRTHNDANDSAKFKTRSN